MKSVETELYEEMFGIYIWLDGSKDFCTIISAHPMLSLYFWGVPEKYEWNENSRYRVILTA